MDKQDFLKKAVEQIHKESNLSKEDAMIYFNELQKKFDKYSSELLETVFSKLLLLRSDGLNVFISVLPAINISIFEGLTDVLLYELKEAKKKGVKLFNINKVDDYKKEVDKVVNHFLSEVKKL